MRKSRVTAEWIPKESRVTYLSAVSGKFIAHAIADMPFWEVWDFYYYKLGFKKPHPGPGNELSSAVQEEKGLASISATQSYGQSAEELLGTMHSQSAGGELIDVALDSRGAKTVVLITHYTILK